MKVNINFSFIEIQNFLNEKAPVSAKEVLRSGMMITALNKGESLRVASAAPQGVSPAAIRPRRPVEREPSENDEQDAWPLGRPSQSHLCQLWRTLHHEEPVRTGHVC
jgi:hypothetical protein